MTIYLVILNDDRAQEIQIPAWSSRALAEAEIARQLAAVTGPEFFWLQNRLEIRELPIDQATDA
jgi:hypothetical protein